MNINNAPMTAIRGLISPKDKQYISTKTTKSIRTIDAVLRCEIRNHEIEQAIFSIAKLNHAQLSRTLSTIENQNLLKTSLNEFQKLKDSPQFANDETFQRYNDIYLRLCHMEFKELDPLWENLNKNVKNIIPKSGYCIDLMVRFDELIQCKIPFYIRIRNNMKVVVPGKGEKKTFWLFNQLKVNQSMHYEGLVYIGENLVIYLV